MGLLQQLKSLFSCSRKSARQHGVIKFFDRKKRFGFIVSDQSEYFFHASSTQAKDFRSLKDGTAVTFTVIQGKKGEQADNVEVAQ